MKTNYLQLPVIRELSAKTLKKSFKKRDKFIKDLKDPKFRAKAKIKGLQRSTIMASPKPKNPALYARVKAEAKKKFKVYPSAYANAWLVRTYKKRGGRY